MRLFPRSRNDCRWMLLLTRHPVLRARRSCSPAIMKLSPIAVSRLADCPDDNITQSLFMRDFILDEASKALVLAILKACGQFLDLAVAFLDPGAQPVPADLFLFCHWTLDDDLARLHVDLDVVRMKKRLRAGDAQPFTALEFLLPFVFIFDRRFQPFIAQRFVGTLGLGEKFGEQVL